MDGKFRVCIHGNFIIQDQIKFHVDEINVEEEIEINDTWTEKQLESNKC
jgi:hypothetical protein